MKLQKRLGILSSGNACPGIEYAIRSIVTNAILTYEWEVWGIPLGMQGLQEGKAVPLSGLAAPKNFSFHPTKEQPACSVSYEIAHAIKSLSDYPVDIQVSVLGQIQRGGTPSASDRLLATAFGKAAVDIARSMGIYIGQT